MSYHTFKRVLGGETSLERKCRILFGASLLLLISSAFWYAGRTAEELVREGGPRRAGMFFVREKMLSYHYARVFGAQTFNVVEAQAMRDALAKDFNWQILVLSDETVRHEKDDETVQRDKNADWEQRTFVVEDPEQREVLLRLRDQVDRDFEEYGRDRLVTLDENGNHLGLKQAIEDPNSPFNNPASELIPHDGEYHYYQPIYWLPNCTAICHRPAELFTDLESAARSRYAFSTEQWLGTPDYYGQPKQDVLRVMKVVIPSEPTQNEIRRTRGILSAIAIATVFFSMIALYAVVRYVIVKPLGHLREVSDEIGRGNYDLRASIQTRDEFEELAASFNRMLRHLVDAQSELRNVNIDLDGKVDQLAQANMQLHEMNRVKSDFLASMSHELRTPLNSIIGFADVLKDNDNLTEKQQRYAANIGNSGRSLLDMINDILDLAKTESGKMEVRLTEFNIDPVVTSQCDLVRSLSEEKNIDLVTEIERGLPPLYQDQGKIQQILLNLLSNAIKFTPEGGRITVTAVRDPMRHLVLTVEDTGVGIAEEERKVIFEKFRQGNQTVGTDHLTREFSGTGLGLSIVKELSKLLGGEVSFESELGKGSTFYVRVPWTLAERPQLDVSITQRLDEMTKPRRIEFSSTGVSTDPIEDNVPVGDNRSVNLSQSSASRDAS